MSLPQILVIDDQYVRDQSMRHNFIDNSGLCDFKRQTGQVESPLAEAVFCSGQRQENGEFVNDYQVIRDAVMAGPPGGVEWAVVLLDVRFDSGRILENGRIFGRPEDDDFGERVREWLALDFPTLPVVMLSGKGQEELNDRETPYLSKRRLTPRDIAVALLRHGHLTSEQQRQLLGLPNTIVAQDQASFAVFREAFAVAASDIPILILGETGTGKEVLASYIHAHSDRSTLPFVPVNVAAIPSDLVETELFGHVKGAFTGAVQKRAGLFAQADGGTLFLDEIGDMTPTMQAKILRALQENVITPVGGSEPQQLDVRIMAATSRDLAAMQRDGTFRDDLTRRISGATLAMPSLRRRHGDIAPLARAFLNDFAISQGKEGIAFVPEALKALASHPFRGNVGELQHIIQWLVNRKGNHSIISELDVREALAGSFISSAGHSTPAPRTTLAPHSSHGLRELLALIETWPVSLDDPLLQGGKPRLEQASMGLLQKMAGAALARFRDPRNGQMNRQAAMQWLTGDDTLKGKGPGRVINEIMRRNADKKISNDDLAYLLRCRQNKDGEG